jgi:hypothetical protein
VSGPVYVVESDAQPNRCDVSLRLRGLTPAQAQQVADALAPLARQFGGALNITDLIDKGDHSLHVGRRKIV